MHFHVVLGHAELQGKTVECDLSDAPFETVRSNLRHNRLQVVDAEVELEDLLMQLGLRYIGFLRLKEFVLIIVFLVFGFVVVEVVFRVRSKQRQTP